jgi:MFS family permease
LSLCAVLCATLGVGLIYGFQPPLLAFVLARTGASSFQIGAVTSVSTIAVIALGPFYPRAIERLGPRYAILIGTSVATAVLLVMPWLNGIQGWLILRFVTGCALGLAWIASEVWLNMLSTDRSRGTVMALYATVFATGVMSGPLLLQFTGTFGNRPFYIGALCLALTVVPMFVPVHAGAGSTREAAPKRSLWRIARVAPVAMFAAFIAGLVEATDISLLPVFGLRQGLEEQTALLLVTVFLAGNVVLQLPIGKLADRFGRIQILAGCALVGVIGPLLLAAFLHTPTLLWPLLLVWGGTLYGFYTQGIALLGDSYPTEELATANAVFVIVYCAGGILGPSLGGVAMDLSPYGLVIFLSVVPLLLAIPCLRRARRIR